jgi:hypothetical protein
MPSPGGYRDREKVRRTTRPGDAARRSIGASAEQPDGTTVTEFGDQLMVRYLSGANADSLLVPAGDTARQRVRALLAGVYQPRLLKVEAVDGVTVTGKRFQVQVVQPLTARGVWEKLVPAPERAMATVEVPALSRTCWIDMVLETTVTVRVSATSALLDDVASEDVSGLPQADFIARFAFLNLPDLMKAARVSTYEELQAEFPHLYRLHYAAPPAYDPADPAAKRTYRLRVSVLFFPTLDLAGAMRRLARARHAVNSVLPRPDGYEGGDLLASSAWLAVFPDAAIGNDTPTRDEISSLLAAEQVVAAFETV